MTVFYCDDCDKAIKHEDPYFYDSGARLCQDCGKGLGLEEEYADKFSEVGNYEGN